MCSNCPHKKNGCKFFSLTIAEYNDHVEKCNYREVYCPVEDCGQKIVVDKLTFHVIQHDIPHAHDHVTVHEEIADELIKLKFLPESCGWTEGPLIFQPLSLYFFLSQTQFYLECRRNPKESGKLLIWCYNVASPKEASKHFVTLSLSPKITFTTPTISLDIDFIEIFERGLAFCFDEELLQNSNFIYIIFQRVNRPTFSELRQNQGQY